MNPALPPAPPAHSIPKAIQRSWRWTLGLCLLVFSALAATAAWSGMGLLRLDEASSEAERSASAERSLQTLASEALDAETGERGFLLTGKPTYLAPYYSALVKIRESISSLDSSLASDPRTKAQMATLASAVAAELSELDRAVRAKSEGPPEAAATPASIEEAKASMDSVRDALAALEASESAKAAARVAERNRQIRENYWTFGLCSALNIALFAGLSQALRQAIRKTMAVHDDQAKLLRSAASRNKQVDGLSELGRLLQSCADMAEASQLLAQHLPPLMFSASGALYLMSEPKDHLDKAFQWGGAGQYSDSFEPSDCWAARLGQPFRQPQGPPSCAHLGQDPLPEDADVRCLPLVAHGELMGLLVLDAGLAVDAQARAEYEGYRRITLEQVGLSIGNMKLRESLRQQSIRDELTGLHNRRYLEEAAGREIRRARRLPKESNGHGIAVLMVDIDHFKSFNDKHGHKVGDLVLREVANAMLRSARDTDIVARYGGEEFAIVLPDIPPDMAHARAEQARSDVEALASQAVGRDIGPVTISVGLARFPEHGSTLEELLLAADAALYDAKNSGRNRVAAAPAPPAPACAPPQADGASASASDGKGVV